MHQNSLHKIHIFLTLSYPLISPEKLVAVTENVLCVMCSLSQLVEYCRCQHSARSRIWQGKVTIEKEIGLCRARNLT